MKTLRQQICELMVRVHRITPELAEYHVSGMSSSDLEFRLQMYARLGFTAGMELSAVGPTSRAGNAVSTPVSAPRDDDGRPAALNPVSGR